MPIDLLAYEDKKSGPIDLLASESGLQNHASESIVDKLANSWPVNATLGAGDAIRDLLSLGYTKKHPSSSGMAYEGGKIAGDIGGFIGGGELLEALPLVGKIAQLMEKAPFGGVGKRLTGSSLFGAAENPEDRIKGAEEGLLSGAIGEGIGAPFRLLGEAAEKVNPIRSATNAQKEIANEAGHAKQSMEEAYNPVHEKYGNSVLSFTPKKYLGFDENETRFFTPDVNKTYKNFINEPTFKNLHELQSQMGKDAAKISSTPAKIKTYQTLSNARNQVMDKLSGFLKRDKEAYDQYHLGREIGREHYYPYFANNNLAKIAEGIKSNLSPKQLINEITKGKENKKIPANHHLIEILQSMEKKTSRGEAYRHLGTLGASVAGSIGGLPAAALAGGATHFLSPHLLEAAQNPSIKKASSQYINPLIRAILQQISPKLPDNG